MNKAIVFLIVVLLAIGFSFLIPGVRKTVIDLTTVSGILQVAGVPPEVLYVYLDGELCGDPGDGLNKPTRTPPADDYGTLVFSATAYDSNADCDAADFFICDNITQPGDCNGVNRFAELTDLTPDQYTCNVYGFDCDNCCCNYSVTWNQFPYFKRCGSWYVNFTVSDTTPYYDSAVKWWKDGMRLQLYYPWVSQGNAGPIIDLGSVYAGQWNNETGDNITKDGGNVPLSLLWNATNFTGYDTAVGYDIPIALCSAIPGCTDGDSTFAIDDTTDWPPCGWINETPSEQIPYPSYGAQRCTTFNCDTGADSQSKYYLYWHIFVEGGKMSGPYNDTIQVDFTYTETCD